MAKQRRSRDREKTISDIFAGAKKLFSSHGLQGTSLRMLEEETGVSKGLILYHFDSKEALFDYVQDVLSDEYAAHLKDLIQPDVNYHDLVEATIRRSLQHQRLHYEYQRIRLWAYLEGRETLPEITIRLTHRLTEMVSKAQEAGQASTTMSAVYAPFIVRGAIEYWVMNKPLIEAVLAEHDLNYEEAEDEFIRQLASLMQ